MFHENLYTKKPIGSIEVICGSMFSGKTEELMRRLRRVEYANQSLQIFKPAIDNRYAKHHIVSHDQRKFNAAMIKDSSEIPELLKTSKVSIDVVAIDEAQFFDDNLVNVGVQLANEGYRIIVAGLDMDYLGKPFGVMPHFLAAADYVTKLHAICVHCGGIAQFTYRKTTEKQQTLVGTAKEYEPRCRGCYQKR